MSVCLCCCWIYVILEGKREIVFTCERGDKGQKEREKDDGSHVFFFFTREEGFEVSL